MGMSFDDSFKAATGHAPFAWQRRLYEGLKTGDVPARCDLPTGLGKTSITAIWALALANELGGESTGSRLPRRLVYVVDRRVVVDQATEEVETFSARLRVWADSSASPELQGLAKAFVTAGFATNEEPLTVSTLRGQHADNRRWLEDPARPAVIVGTVDMVGSRLFFSGYGGLGRYSRSLHAGLLAQDALIVVDEAQLCPSFVESLQALASQLTGRPLIRPFRVMLLSATQPPPAAGAPQTVTTAGQVFSLDPAEDRQDEEVARRLDAPKRLEFVNPSSGSEQKPDDAYANALAKEAVGLAGTGSAVVVFANTVERVNQVKTALQAVPLNVPKARIVTLTGEMRGKERDELVGRPVFALFRKRRRDRGNLEHPVFLVTTAAGEVGINFDADHAVCDVVPLERMIQRLGRVNRFGDGHGEVRVVLPPTARDGRSRLDKTLVLRATRRVLRSLPRMDGAFDASTASLSALLSSPASSRLVAAAFSPAPPSPPLDEARLDDWAFTTLKAQEFPRPQVSYWLRGLTPDDTPQTWLAWRADLAFATAPEEAARMAEAIPLAPAEIAQVRTHRAVDLLGKLRKRHPNAIVALLSPVGEWTGLRLTDLPEKNDERFRALLLNTLVLPAGLGGLKEGGVEDSDKLVPDAVDRARFRRVILRATAESCEAAELASDGTDTPLGNFDSLNEARRKLPALLGTGTKFLHLSGADWESTAEVSQEPAPQALPRVAYFGVRADSADLADAEDLAALQPKDVPLQRHLDQTADVARKLCAKLSLAPELADAVVQACARHDTGKRQPQWQKAIDNAGQAPLAKSAKPGFDHEATRGFRHEFLSLLEAADDHALAAHRRRDLILHLIAAHHGHARPGFSSEAYGILPLHARCSAAAHEAALRFTRLQRELGWWQLAYLEALVKCADAIASREADAATP